MALTRDHILRLFDDIEENDHLYRVRFYESNSSLIFSLDESQQQYFNFHYVNSLFELGKYDHVLAEIDPLIEYVFMHNISFGYGDSFEALLLKKAASFHNTFQYTQSLEVSLQLIGMNPHQPIYQSLAKRSYRAMFHWNTSSLRLMIIIVVLVTAGACAIFGLTNGQLPGKTFLTSFLILISPCLLALGSLGLSYLYGLIRSDYLVTNLIKAKKQEKRALRKKL